MRVIRRATSPFIVYDEKLKVTSYRTPAAVLAWPHEFRMRIVRSWIAPNVFITSTTLRQYRNYMCAKPYIVQGMAVQFYLVSESSKNFRHNVGIYLHREGDSRMLHLSHPDDAARSLSVYNYLADAAIPLRFARYEDAEQIMLRDR